MHYGIVPRFKAREKDLSASHQTIIGYGCPLASSGDNFMSEAELSSREWEHWLGKGHLDGDPTHTHTLASIMNSKDKNGEVNIRFSWNNQNRVGG